MLGNSAAAFAAAAFAAAAFAAAAFVFTTACAVVASEAAAAKAAAELPHKLFYTFINFSKLLSRGWGHNVFL